MLSHTVLVLVPDSISGDMTGHYAVSQPNHEIFLRFSNVRLSQILSSLADRKTIAC